MSDKIDLWHYALPSGALIDVLFSDAASAEKASLIANLRNRRQKGRTALKEQREKFDKLFEKIARSDAEPTAFADLAEVVLRDERAATEQLCPRLEALHEKLAAEGYKLDPEIRRYFQENLDIAAGWLGLYETLHSRLLAMASHQKPGLGDILRARPVAGDIDYNALSREHIARYPKIRAALAK